MHNTNNSIPGTHNGEAITHLCNDFERLKQILDQRMFLPSYCKEQVDFSFNNPDGNSISHRYAIPMVSFCDVTIPFIKESSNYGKYGIGLKVQWAISNKMNPVLYLEKRSHAATGVKRSLDFIHENKSPNNIDKKVIEGATWFIQYVKAREIKLFSSNDIRVIDCYNEREWRYIPQIKEADKAKYPDIIYSDEYDTKLAQLGAKPHFNQKYGLSFSLDDIAFITVKQDTDAQQIKEIFLHDESIFDKIIVL